MVSTRAVISASMAVRVDSWVWTQMGIAIQRCLRRSVVQSGLHDFTSVAAAETSNERRLGTGPGVRERPIAKPDDDCILPHKDTSVGDSGATEENAQPVARSTAATTDALATRLTLLLRHLWAGFDDNRIAAHLIERRSSQLLSVAASMVSASSFGVRVPMENSLAFALTSLSSVTITHVSEKRSSVLSAKAMATRIGSAVPL